MIAVGNFETHIATSISSFVNRDMSWPVPPFFVRVNAKGDSRVIRDSILGHSTSVKVLFRSSAANCRSGDEKCSRTEMRTMDLIRGRGGVLDLNLHVP